MKNLIEALQIFAKYTDTKYPTWCRHDELHVAVNYELVSDKDIDRLAELGFMTTDEDGEKEFYSFHYGNC